VSHHERTPVSTTEHAGQVAKRAETGYLALIHEPKEVQDIIAANLGGQELSAFDLPRVKIPGAGGTTWEKPSLEGDVATKVLEGIVVHFKRVRSYWPGEFAGSEPPACSSSDSKVGVGDPGGDCEHCPFAQWESGKAGRGQACKQMEQWFLLQPDSLLPLVVTLPPMSLQGAKKYRLNLTNAMLAIGHVVTSLTLAKATNPDGQEFAYAVPALARRLEPEEAARARAYADSIRDVLDRAPAVAPPRDEASGDLGMDVTDAELEARAAAYEPTDDEEATF
jgi:hypothetical protein